MSLWSFSILLVPPASEGQKDKRSLSQTTKAAIKKILKAPAAARNRVKALEGAEKAKVREAQEIGKPAKAQTNSFTSPGRASAEPEAHHRASGGKRDPFHPWGLKTKTKQRPRRNLSPLERYELGQLKLVGIVWDVKEPKAMVEDAAGLGYIIKVGALIGTNEGKVKTIRPNEVVIKETYTDFYGARKSREVKLRLSKE